MLQKCMDVNCVLPLFIGPLCKATPCQNGGTCQQIGKNRTCDCVAGYTGEDCETGMETSGSLYRNIFSSLHAFRMRQYVALIINV